MPNFFFGLEDKDAVKKTCDIGGANETGMMYFSTK